MSPPPSAKGARRRDPEPCEPHGPGPRAKTCSSYCLSWLHPLRSWSLRQTRGGSVRTSSRRPIEARLAVIHLRLDGARNHIGVDESRLGVGVGTEAAGRVINFQVDQRLARDWEWPPRSSA